MTTEPEKTEETKAAPAIHVAPSPHLSDTSVTTRRMMIDVVIALTPAIVAAIVVFRGYAVLQLVVCVVSCLAAEALFTAMRGKPVRLNDFSAAVTGLILALSLPWSAPWYVGVIGSFVAIGLGKVVFGGLGCNIFNPAMVGRAFVMLSFAALLGAPAYVSSTAGIDAVTQATPLTAAKKLAASLADGSVSLADIPSQLGAAGGLGALFIGTTNGSLGEISAILLLLGGIYLCVRRSASWEIPVGVVLATMVWTGLGLVLKLTVITPPHHVFAGALLFGALFIATDPVSSPLTPKGKFIFGLGVGSLVVLFRLFSGYPEGVMFAVLLMNALTPLINNWTIPRPLGGPVAAKT